MSQFSIIKKEKKRRDSSLHISSPLGCPFCRRKPERQRYLVKIPAYHLPASFVSNLTLQLNSQTHIHALIRGKGSTYCLHLQSVWFMSSRSKFSHHNCSACAALMHGFSRGTIKQTHSQLKRPLNFAKCSR